MTRHYRSKRKNSRYGSTDADLPKYAFKGIKIINILITLPKGLIEKIITGEKLFEMRKCLPKHISSFGRWGRHARSRVRCRSHAAPVPPHLLLAYGLPSASQAYGLPSASKSAKNRSPDGKSPFFAYGHNLHYDRLCK